MIKPWTDGRLKSFITTTLRSGMRRYPPKYEALNAAYTCKKINLKSGRNAKHYRCAGCNEDFPSKDVQVDHRDPVVESTGFVDWNTFIVRLFCPVENLQVLCIPCHKKVTQKERVTRMEVEGIRKKYPRESKTYWNMMSRCYNPNIPQFEYWGGKGVEVCDRWKQDFFNFLEDMGEKPEGYSLDRIDVHGNYTKENCRWATPVEQARNTTGNNFIDFDDKCLCLEEWGELLNIKPNTILTRLRRGWPIEEALEFSKKEKPIYNGRLSQGDIEDLVSSIESGISQSEYGRRIGMDSSQVSRLYHKFKD